MFKRWRAIRAYRKALTYHEMHFAHSTPLTINEEGKSLLKVLRLYLECLRLGMKP